MNSPTTLPVRRRRADMRQELATLVAGRTRRSLPCNDGGPFLEARLADVVLRAALLTGCPVHIVPTVPATLDEGMGAILAVRATPASLTELLEV